MCTLLFAWRALSDAPIALAANRDEADDRPSEPPAIRDFGGTRVLAPLDREAGGTWLGVNEAGVVAGLANRWTDQTLAADRSRGLLVRDVLASSDAPTGAATVRDAIANTAYDGFTMIVADADAGWLLTWDGEFHETRLDPGLHVVVNVGADDQFSIPDRRRELGERQAAGARAARDDLAVQDGEDRQTWLDRAADALVDHDRGFCVHGNGYGTRSSTLLSVADDGSVWMAYGDGRPCEIEPRTVDAQL